MLFQRRRNAHVQLLPSPAQQGGVGSVLYQRVLEQIGRVRSGSAAEQQSGVLPVAAVLPGGDFLGEGLLVGDAAIETLARQHAEFGLSHVQPAAVFGRVVPFEPLDEFARLGCGERFVE